jgi:hypothetical protein
MLGQDQPPRYREGLADYSAAQKKIGHKLTRSFCASLYESWNLFKR